MIAKGIPHPNGVRLARYLITSKGDELAELWQLRGFASANIVEAFQSVHAMAAATKCRNVFFHLSLRGRHGEKLTRSQWQYAVNRVEKMLGLDGQPCAVAFHKDLRTGDEHLHAAWSRICLDTLTARPLPFFKMRLKTVCRQLEEEFGLAPVPNQRESSIRFAPTRDEEEQSRRLGVNVHDQREIIRACFERSDCGRSFQSALAAEGIVLARGDRRDFIAVDRAGAMHALGKRILGVSAAKIRGRLAEIPKEGLPTVEEARHAIRNNGVTRAETAFQITGVPSPSPEPRVELNLQEALQNQAFVADEPPVNGGEEMIAAASCTIEGTSGSAATQESQRCVAQTPATLAHIGDTAKASRSFAGALRAQLREAAKALLRRLPSPAPQFRRRRKGEAAGGFVNAARAIFQPTITAPFGVQTCGVPLDTLPWFHLLVWFRDSDHDIGAGQCAKYNDHFSPHPE
jgi:hypothetical protein